MSKSESPAPRNFEEAMAELEKLLADLERGDIPLEESLARYERGTLLIRYCGQVLKEAERKVEVLTRGEDGTVKIEPLK